MNPSFFYTVAASTKTHPEYGYTGVWLRSGTVTVSSAWTMSDVTVSSAHTQYVFNSGVAQSSLVSSGGYLYVSSGGVATGTQVYSAGIQRLYTGGFGSDLVLVGGTMQVSSGGVGESVKITSGGTAFVSAGGRLNNVNVSGIAGKGGNSI